jgi:hypothetical protein
MRRNITLLLAVAALTMMVASGCALAELVSSNDTGPAPTPSFTPRPTFTPTTPVTIEPIVAPTFTPTATPDATPTPVDRPRRRCHGHARAHAHAGNGAAGDQQPDPQRAQRPRHQLRRHRPGAQRRALRRQRQERGWQLVPDQLQRPDGLGFGRLRTAGGRSLAASRWRPTSRLRQCNRRGRLRRRQLRSQPRRRRRLHRLRPPFPSRWCRVWNAAIPTRALPISRASCVVAITRP